MQHNLFPSQLALTLLVSLIWICASQGVSKTPVIYFPLDERFATRGIFLNLANITSSDHEIFTPPLDIVCSYRQSADLPALYAWFEKTLDDQCRTLKSHYSCIIILSSELFLYGGLISSRISNTSTATIIDRVNYLNDIKQSYGNNIIIYLSNVVMRIPAYNS